MTMRIRPTSIVLLLTAGASAAAAPDDPTQTARDRMVDEQLVARGIKDASVLAAMRRVPRHEFVPEPVRRLAYADRPLPIGFEQTISQPAVVARMTELTGVRRGSRVLEIGTGSGYQTAVLSAMGAEVYTIEIVAPLGERAARLLARLGYGNVRTRIGDGYRGWRLVIPVGDVEQELRVLTRTRFGWEERTVIPVAFVPMTGEAQRPAPPTPPTQR